MDTPTLTPQKADLRDYLATERTFLAWIRTGLALMGFGFVLARFGIYLQQFLAMQPSTPPQSPGLSLWFGTALILVGVAVNVFAGWRYVQLVRNLDRGETSYPRSSTRMVVVAWLLALVGLAMAIYLISIRETTRSNSANGKETSMAINSDKGMIDKPSNHSVDETVAKLKGILQAKGITLFALVDHSGEAEKVGMKMPPTKLLIFGNPKGGTPLMLAAPSTAIDLPLKILVWEDAQKKVWISYNSPQYLQQRHGFPQDLLPNIAVVETLATKAGE